MKKTYEVTAFNTFTRKFEKTVVSKEVYQVYTRSGWNIHDNDDSFFGHELQISSLIGGQDGSFENFKEFIVDESNPETLAIAQEAIVSLHRAIEHLSPKEKEVIIMFFFYKLSSKEIGRLLGITEQAVTKRRRNAFKHIESFLKKD